MLSYDTPAFRARFFAKVDSSNVWIGARTPDGYGMIYAAGHNVLAHRVAWELAHGVPIPDGLWVLHNCPDGDNPACIDPSHLWLGTHAQNMADMVAKGRSATGDRHGSRVYPESRARGDRNGMRTHPESVARGDAHYLKMRPDSAPRGELNGRARLTAAIVTEIRARHHSDAGGAGSIKALSAEYGVSYMTIWDVVKRNRWKHVT